MYGARSTAADNLVATLFLRPRIRLAFRPEGTVSIGELPDIAVIGVEIKYDITHNYDKRPIFEIVNPNFRRPPPANRRLTRQENREVRINSLRKGAIIAVARHDIEGATVEKICEAAGASRGLLSHYFDSKESLLLDTLAHWFSSAHQIKDKIATDLSLSARCRLIEVAKASFTPPTYSWEMAAAWQAYTNASRHNAAYAKPIRAASVQIRKLLCELYKQAANEEDLSLDIDQLALGLTILDDGLWNSLATGKDNVTIKQAKHCCELYINRSLILDPSR